MPIPREAFLEKILSQPTAPYRESHVAQVITKELERRQVPYFKDPIGNLVLGVASKSEYLNLISGTPWGTPRGTLRGSTRRPTRDPVRLFIAHLDHPGFHGVRWLGPNRLAIRWHGGSPTRHLNGSKVWLADSGSWRAEGRLAQAKMIPSGRALESGTVILSPKGNPRSASAPPPATKVFGGFGFRAPFWKKGKLIYTQAADDLVGAFAVTSMALEMASKGSPFLGLLTRAEEVGYVGAIGHFEQGWLKSARRPILCVSLETSRTLPGAEIGKGPVVRLGDRFTVFDAGALRIFSDLAQKVLPDRHQRRVMDGGTCEGTAATVYGFPTVGISVPLGNYHNQSFQGGPDSRGPLGPAPEFVHQDDVVGLLELCRALLRPKTRWDRPWAPKLQEFKKRLRGARPLLRY